MKNGKVLSGLAFVALLLLLTPGCTLPDQPADTPPADAISYDQLLANLDALQGPAAKDLGAGGLSAQDLSTYLTAIKTDIAAFVYSRTGGRPYLVAARRLSWNGPKGPESGLMWVPVTWGLRASIICYQHGTQVYQECAPSRHSSNPLAVLASPDLTGALQSYVECTVGALMASAGYIVVMPDYVGFGDSTGPDHPYVTMALGDSVRGALKKAASSFSWWSAVKPNGKVFLTGYSEGGYATMAGARKLQDAPVSGLTVVGIVPCDGAYDLTGVMLPQMVSMDLIPVPSYLLYTASGYHAVYGDAGINYGLLLASPWAGYVALGLFDGTHTNGEVGAVAPATTPPRTMLNEANIGTLLVDGGTVYELLEANNAWVGWKPGTAPIILVHCPADDVVPYANAEHARDRLAGLAPVVRIVDVPAVPLIKTVMGTEHVAAYPTAMLAAFTSIDLLNR